MRALITIIVVAGLLSIAFADDTRDDASVRIKAPDAETAATLKYLIEQMDNKYNLVVTLEEGESTFDVTGDATARRLIRGFVALFRGEVETYEETQKAVVAFTESVIGQEPGRLEEQRTVPAGSAFEVRGTFRVPFGQKPGPVTVKVIAASNGRDVITDSKTANLEPASDGTFAYKATLRAPSTEGEYNVRVTTEGTSLIAEGALQVHPAN